MSRFPNIQSVWKFLEQIPMFSHTGAKAANFDLGNIRSFCEAMGDPQNTFKSIHIAGTNGKGTTAHLLEAVYRQAGYKTGLFTSPHLIRYNERVRIEGIDIPDRLILDFFREAEPLINKIPLTYFEWSTALAFWAFAKEKVDIAIIESGLGGRFDSTNILTPELSIITSVGLDHEQILGNSIHEIAQEKAGIIKPGTPVVVGELPKEALSVISEKCERLGSGLYQAGKLMPAWEHQVVQLVRVGIKVKTNFYEPVNRWNVAMAFKAQQVLSSSFPVTISDFREAVETFEGIPARFELLHPGRRWFFSGSHNVEAINAMLEGIEVAQLCRPALVLSLMKDKVKPEILNKFRNFAPIYYYQQNGERAASFDMIRKSLPAIEIDNSNAQTILNELTSSVVIFAGSFYFYRTVKQWLT